MDFFIELNEKFLLQNLIFIKNIAACQLAPVIKANAYGHGMKEVISILKKNPEIKRVCVISYEEALEAKKNNWFDKIIILSPGLIIQYDIQYEYFIHSFELLNNIIKYAKLNKIKMNIHIKFNVGLNRMGFNYNELAVLIEILKLNYEYIKIVGIGTHLPRINYEMNNEIEMQIKLFMCFINKIKLVMNHDEELMIHPFGCRGFNLIKKYNISCNMIRPGGLIYGLIKEEFHDLINIDYPEVEFKQVMTLKAQISNIRLVEKDQYIGYGNTYQATEDCKIAIVNFGYGNGYSIQMGKSLYAGYINNSYLSLVGIIGMNNIFFKIPPVLENLKVGDYIILSSYICSQLHATRISTLYLESREYVFTSFLNSNIPKIIV